MSSTYQQAKAVSSAKSDIMERSDKKSILSERMLKASLGMSTGAPMARTSSACWPASRESNFHPYIRIPR